ncbi:lytic transglycosylase domain-containing protein [Treponema parvum]|uniref:Lytic transglycosylase domain-containing protein n=1 Tax=Treponema parvum TaxID=138851 RepID=A0A975IDR9_9SPIR|nr:lytic transglycosylase domain-containing protein [Treponema parvum]QTQ13093.1 lytic transglycosylase domain-containing protein [Treponema parvum]
MACLISKTVRFLVFSLIFSTLSCSSESGKLQKQYGKDSYYFQGLKSIEKNDVKNAERFFRKGIKEGSKYTARLCAEELTRFGNIQERIASCEYLAKKFPDDRSLILLASSLNEGKEFSKLIAVTDDLDIRTCSNVLAFQRLAAMREKQDLRYEDTVYKWFVLRQYTQEHFRFFKENPLAVSDENKKNILLFRTAVFTQNYQFAYKQIKEISSLIKDTISNGEDPRFIRQLISDMGKACLFGSEIGSFIAQASLFDDFAILSASKGDSETAFYAWFYAARLYEKAGGHHTLASDRYLKAMEASVTGNQYDNALWYLLNLDLGISTDKAIQRLETYCTKWNDPEYFSDLFYTMSVLLLSGHKLSDFYKVYTIIKDVADEDVCAKYAYLSARLIETKLIESAADQKTEEDIQKLFRAALKGGSVSYYKLLAAERLNLSGQELENALFSLKRRDSFDADKDAENLLLGYASYGFPQKIYSAWEQFYLQRIPLGTDCLLSVSSFINKCSGQIPGNLYKSLRIASIAVNESDRILSKKDLKEAYPQNYSDLVFDACKEFSLDEGVLYALIRSESFFDPDIRSSAGAVGLTQLMHSTGQDIANRLKVKEYDLTDPQTSVRFGAYYLSNLIGRLDSSILLAAFAYNSGISRVRRWVSNSKKELEISKTLPMDLFLETIPFSETREYGRKIVFAAAIYGWLYYDITPGETIRKIMK